MHIKVYGLLSCPHCREAREYLLERAVEFDSIYPDLLVGEEKSDMMRELRNLNPELTFPTIVIDGKVIVGFKKYRIAEALAAEPEKSSNDTGEGTISTE